MRTGSPPPARPAIRPGAHQARRHPAALRGGAGGGRPGRGGAVTDAVAVAAGPGRLGGCRGSAHHPGAGHAGYRMTAGGELPERVLVVRCPGWPEAGRETGAADDDAGPGGGAAPGAGQRAPDFGQVVSVVEEFCPRVEVLRPGACAIGVRGPARYFGGEGALAARIIDAVAD